MVSKPLLVLLVVGIVLISGCVEQQPTQPKPTTSITPTTTIEKTTTIEETTTTSASPIDVEPGSANVSGVVEANNKFALDFYSQIRDDEDNLFFSPWSLSAALAMTYEGARGQTAEEMQEVFHFPEDESTRLASYASLISQINKQDKEYQLNTANALWAQEDYPFRESYMKLIQEYYSGKITNLDFKTKTEPSRLLINDWVENQTNDKIQDLIPQGAINPLTRLVLTNAIYFKGDWITQFNETNTQEEDFRVSPDNTVKAPMMRLTGSELRFNYTETEKLKVLELPYKGDELSMLILLPKEDDIDSVEQSLTVEKLKQWHSNLIEQKVDIYLPKFKLETKYFLKETLMAMGMPTAFSSGADFSRMDGTMDLAISQVIHQAFVEVNEEGTEAAAATAVIMELTAIIQNPVFRADHPFIFIIQDKQTGNILFMGKLANPNE